MASGTYGPVKYKPNGSDYMIDKSVLAKAHYKANEAARVIEQAPLFCWNGIKDAKGEELQPVFYTEAPLIVNSEKGIFIHAISEAGFSRLVLDCFKVLETCYVMKGYSRTHLILVHPFHPLYPQIKAAAEGKTVKQMPLFYFNGIRDEKGGELQRAIYSYEKPHDIDNSAIRVTATNYTSFSPLVHSCFTVNNSTSDQFTVATTHPLYPQVKAAFEAWAKRYEKGSAAWLEKCATSESMGVAA
ncbi:hypothetical protein [Xylella fastidiosa]|uniref:hypothetical protein n=1 Tax=Xylella fastidiosa TaxID=2371 RepID=UPI0003D2A35F|nr:hypothetical protein [Xylella fastidiosa]WGZ33067.1 hypothetical protein O4444_05610 [Xylella fastidiosa subsp. pauca]WGZ35316.1 hypothetical protein O4445_05460 [Xylella fastidiosa subsp. pauca]WGZ37586.1 hypothetical protein O4443_05435 [Xylella fastidiosa subsp. pauca]